MVCEKHFLRNKARFEQPLCHLDDTPHVKCENEAKAGAGMGDSTEFDTVSENVEKCRILSRGWRFLPSGRRSSYGIDLQWDRGRIREPPRGSQRALQAENRVSCRNVGCEAAAAGRASDEK